MAIIQIKDTVKRYGSLLSVDHLNLDIREGEIFGLLGPNGAGKSTTINMLSGLLPIDKGDITVQGVSVASDPLKVKGMLGLVPQDLAIYEELTAIENVTFFARLYGLKGKLLQERVKEALAFVGLSDRSKDKPGSFSGGMKRRLNIACAITHRPKVIIMDEPTVGIDPQSRNHILESVKELNRLGSTIIYTTHYMEEVEAIGTRVGIIDKGRLIACGTKAELVERVSDEEKLVIDADGLTEEALGELELHPKVNKLLRTGSGLELYMGSSHAYLQDVLFILTKHNVKLQSITRVEPDLESLFLSLTGKTLRD
ncbi:antibiotic ABC transporter ATP-binding protein [Paenibacillus oryzae]|uniref:Antibiotic ABC transporter ATP-binding protein n=1 Tax=Paenibacillus oryzae TaxID=1844972 RepID=A0A1A5YCD4_9BACL|nr:ABC transporter ATP-binding protein [Paenibacillus oryzae]OBR63249.1 antibiotic ABC transporter ATP-binding protein [Paenibacillus oryzae]